MDQLTMGRRRLNAADEELAIYFTSSVGVRAQSYEVFGSTTIDPHAARIAQLGRIQEVDAVAGTLAKVPREHRHVLVLVYGIGAGALGDERGLTDIDLRLLQALQPRAGYGTYVWLATTLPKARDTYDKHLRKGGHSTNVLTYLQWEATEHPKESTSLFNVLKAECTRLRKAALDAYSPFREERIGREREEREALRASRERDRERFLAEELEITRNIRKARFERRLRRMRRAS